MKLQNKKFIVIGSGGLKIPIDEDELLKVYKAITTGEPTILRQGWLKPSYFIGVVEDEEKMKMLYEDLKYEIRDGKVTEYPKYKDLFVDLREQVKQINIIGQDNKKIGNT